MFLTHGIMQGSWNSLFSSHSHFLLSLQNFYANNFEMNFFVEVSELIRCVIFVNHSLSFKNLRREFSISFKKKRLVFIPSPHQSQFLLTSNFRNSAIDISSSRDLKWFLHSVWMSRERAVPKVFFSFFRESEMKQSNVC